MKRLILLTSFFVATAFALHAEASFIPTMTGASAFSGAGRAGFVNFAVYANAPGSNWITDLGLGGDVAAISGAPGADGSERNVFFYQVTRTDTGAPALLTTLTIPFGFDQWVKAGVVTSKVFTDVGGAVVGSLLGANNSLDAGGITGFTGAASVNSSFALVDNFGGGGDFSWTPPGMIGGGTSSVVFFTSQSNPLNPTSTTQSNGAALLKPASITGGATALVPVANPEPGSLILLSLAGIGGAGLSWRKRRKAQGQPCADDHNTVVA